MSTATVMNHCAHCGKPIPDDNRRDMWSIHDVPHNDGTIRTVAVCPSCRVGGAPPEDHEPGSCSGTYTGPDAYVAECKEWGCRKKWACWDKKCVEDWQDEHFEDYCECPNCADGHHDSKLTEPKKPRL